MAPLKMSNLRWTKLKRLNIRHIQGGLRFVCTFSLSLDNFSEVLPNLQEAERAAYQAMQTAAEAQSNVPLPAVAGPEVTQDSVAMNVDVEAPERGKKRGAEEEPSSDGHKKARLGSFISCSHVRARADGR